MEQTNKPDAPPILAPKVSIAVGVLAITFALLVVQWTNIEYLFASDRERENIRREVVEATSDRVLYGIYPQNNSAAVVFSWLLAGAAFGNAAARRNGWSPATGAGVGAALGYISPLLFFVKPART